MRAGSAAFRSAPPRFERSNAHMSEYGDIILGGTGQVGSVGVKTHVNSPRCREVVLRTRRQIANSLGERVRLVTVDPEKANFVQEVASLVQASATLFMCGAS